MDDSWRDSCCARRETERCDGHLSGNHNYFQSGLQVKRKKGKVKLTGQKNESNDFLQDDLLDKEVIKAFG